MPFKVMCAEHEIELNTDGTCPCCFDLSFKPFVLDMQSTYLEPVTGNWGMHPAEGAIDVLCAEYEVVRCKEFER